MSGSLSYIPPSGTVGSINICRDDWTPQEVLWHPFILNSASIYIYIHIHTHIYTYIYTHIYTYIYNFLMHVGQDMPRYVHVNSFFQSKIKSTFCFSIEDQEVHWKDHQRVTSSQNTPKNENFWRKHRWISFHWTLKQASIIHMNSERRWKGLTLPSFGPVSWDPG